MMQWWSPTFLFFAFFQAVVTLLPESLSGLQWDSRWTAGCSGGWGRCHMIHILSVDILFGESTCYATSRIFGDFLRRKKAWRSNGWCRENGMWYVDLFLCSRDKAVCILAYGATGSGKACGVWRWTCRGYEWMCPVFLGSFIAYRPSRSV